ncbi:MAG: site-specific integrase [Thermoguttaceae bacterium]
MSSTTVSVPKYRHHKGTGQAFVQVKGRRHYLGKWDTQASKERYSRFVAELAASPIKAASLPLATPAAPITVVELCAAYLDFAQAYYRKADRLTSQAYIIRQAMRPLRELYGHTRAADFGPLAVQVVKTHLIQRGLARKTVNHVLGTIKRIFKWAVAQELAPVTVYQGLLTVAGAAKGRTKARETDPIGPVADELVEATLPYLPAVVADMVRFQRLTGARPGEVCQLRPCDVDRSGDVWEYRPADHKTAYRGRERCIYIGPKTQAVLLPYLLRDAQVQCFSPAESEQQRHVEQRAVRKTPVQPSQRAKPVRAPATCYTKDSYNRAITRAIVKANKARTEEAADMGVEPVLLPHWHANQLRHSKATEVRRQFGLEAAQVSLGHAKADVTQIYAERDARLAMEVARKIG